MATLGVPAYQTKSKRNLFADVPVAPVLTATVEPAELELELELEEVVPIDSVSSEEEIFSNNNNKKGGKTQNKPKTTQGGNFFTRLFGGIAGHNSRSKKRRSAAPTTKGVYFDSRTDDVPSDSVKTIDTANSGDGEAVYVPNWIPSNRENHQQDVPVVVRRPEYDTYNEADDKKLLKKIMSKAKKLPQEPGKYASNHVMINAERTKRNIPPMRRERHMDQIAREQAKLMTEEKKLFHINTPNDLQNRLKEKDKEHHELPTFQRMGMNIGRGKTITEVHRFMMAALAERNNIQDKRFFAMGMGTHRAENGVLYMCQIFGG